MPDDPLRERLTAALTALDVEGYRALPCRVCNRVGAVRVHDLYQLLQDVRDRCAGGPAPPETRRDG